MIFDLFRKKLGGAGDYPIPARIVRIINRVYPNEKALGLVAYILKGNDVTYVAPNDLGCAESASRMIRVLVPSFPVCTGTIALKQALDTSPYFERTWDRGDGVVWMAETGKGLYAHGHVGVEWKGYIYSNNSKTGKIDSHFTPDTFTRYYYTNGGFPKVLYKYKNI